MRKYFFIIICFLTIQFSCKLKRGTVIDDGKGTVTQKLSLYCSEPRKRYTKDVQAAVKGSIQAIPNVGNVDVETSLKTQVAKLTDYSQKGLDIDLILFRICEMSINRNFTSEQTEKLINEAIHTWDQKMSTNQQKNIISQLNVELATNLKTANELKKNVETILSNITTVAGEQILRNEKIKILPLFFPKENLELPSKKSASDLVRAGVDEYLKQKLDTNRLEKQKFSDAGKVIAMTVNKTSSTLNSLADKEHKRYEFSEEIWKTNSANLSKIDVFDITKFQVTYGEFNSLRNNYDIVVSRSIDYLNDLESFFKPDKNIITEDGIEKILTSERLSFDMIVTYSKSLQTDIENLVKLQEIVTASLK